MVCGLFFISFTVSLLNLWCKPKRQVWEAFMLLSYSFHTQAPHFKHFKWSHGFQSRKFQNEASTSQKGRTLFLLLPSPSYSDIMPPASFLTIILSGRVYSANNFTLAPSRGRWKTFCSQWGTGINYRQQKRYAERRFSLAPHGPGFKWKLMSFSGACVWSSSLLRNHAAGT